MNRKKGPEKGIKYVGTNPHSYGKILAQQRRKRGLTQKELAEKSGVSKRTITYYERETLNPTVATLNKLATTLEIPVEKFLNGQPNDRVVPDRSLNKRFETVQMLPVAARNDIKRYIDNVVKAYGVAGNAE